MLQQVIFAIVFAGIAGWIAYDKGTSSGLLKAAKNYYADRGKWEFVPVDSKNSQVMFGIDIKFTQQCMDSAISITNRFIVSTILNTQYHRNLTNYSCYGELVRISKALTAGERSFVMYTLGVMSHRHREIIVNCKQSFDTMMLHSIANNFQVDTSELEKEIIAELSIRKMKKNEVIDLTFTKYGALLKNAIPLDEKESTEVDDLSKIMEKFMQKTSEQKTPENN